MNLDLLHSSGKRNEFFTKINRNDRTVVVIVQYGEKNPLLSVNNAMTSFSDSDGLQVSEQDVGQCADDIRTLEDIQASSSCIWCHPSRLFTRQLFTCKGLPQEDSLEFSQGKGKM